jgi:hypothetical protein
MNAVTQGYTTFDRVNLVARMSTRRFALALLTMTVSAVVAERRAHAYGCNDFFHAYIGVMWAGTGSGYVPVGGDAVMFAHDGDCKVRFSVPPDEVVVSAARKVDGPYEPTAIQKMGKLFAWRPPSEGLWFLRIERVTPRGSGPKSPGTAVVVAYPPNDMVHVKLTLDGSSEPPGLLGLFPVLGPEVERLSATGAFEQWAKPHLVLKRSAGSRTIAARIPRGTYRAGEARRLTWKLDDRQSSPTSILVDEPRKGLRSAPFDVKSDGEVRLELQLQTTSAASGSNVVR